MRQNINSPTYLAIFIMLGFLLSALALPASAEHLELSWTNATTRADGSAFDAETELASINIGCGESLAGPFDAYTAKVQNEGDSPAPTGYVTDAAPNTLKGCVAFSVDLNGLVSAPSNVAKLDYKSPISALQDLQTHCYGSCPGTVNFHFTINTSSEQ
jgi:hypothetical protein